MLNHHINSSDNSGTDHLQAAAIEWQRNLHKELEADNLAAERPTARSDNNYMAKLVVAQALRLNAEQSAMVNEQA